MSDRLKALCGAFKHGLDAIRKRACDNGIVKDIAGVGVNDGCPPKYAICAAFALCDQTMREQFAPSPIRWRCAMSDLDGDVRTRVQHIVEQVGPAAMNLEDPWARCEDPWPTIKEFMFDFSFSNYRIPELTGQWDGWPNGSGTVFRLLLAAESEVQGTGFTGRVNLVTRDLVKLCLVKSDLKVLVYKGYDQEDEAKGWKDGMLARIETTIKRCYENEHVPGEWLFLGLLGKWPESQSAYQHILTPQHQSITSATGW
ncbi:MAG: hypothetical protein J0I06_07740 [Planctomycetes bacterium]|nr:hypothetical protein [Planctomycetota bacterium]